MSRFRSQFKRGGSVSLVRQFGETITYIPSNGIGRSIQAIIERNVATPIGTTANEIICRVLDDAVLGISSTEINDGRDKVCLSLTMGGTEEIREITRMDDDSNGMVRFTVR